jgi:hypothetical protein
MNTIAGVMAGFLVIGGAVALYRFGARKAAELRQSVDEIKAGAGSKGAGAVLDFERDPKTGAYRARR